MSKHLEKHKIFWLTSAGMVCVFIIFVFVLPKFSKKPIDEIIDTDSSSSVSNYAVQRDDAIQTYLLSQKQFSWKTQEKSLNLCVFEQLDPKKELFPLPLWIRCGEFILEKTGVKELSGVSLPILLSYPNELSFFDETRFTHKAPRDGALYAGDIKTIFSADVQKSIASFEQKSLSTMIQTLARKTLEMNATKTPMTVTGKMICLSHKDTNGPQTLECAYGLRDEHGMEYGLSDPKGAYLMNLPTDTTVTVTGVYTKAENTKYKAEGTIEIESVVK